MNEEQGFTQSSQATAEARAPTREREGFMKLPRLLVLTAYFQHTELHQIASLISFCPI